MAASTLPAPGTEYGPCHESCDHRDCARTRRDAAENCRLCGNEIGYETRFYSDPEPAWISSLVHALCLERSIR
jgi:hypothetical protein